MSEHFRVSPEYPPTFNKERSSLGLYRDKPGDDQFDIPASFNDDMAKEDVPKSNLHERRSKSKLLGKFCFEHSSTSQSTKCIMTS